MAIQDTIDTPLARACRKIGSQSALARLVGRDQSTVYEWLLLGKALPAEHVLAVEAATGISRHVLRPDIYPVDDPGPPSPTDSRRGARDHA